MAVWLVTGATGFIGRHVWDDLHRGVEGAPPCETEIVAVGRRRPPGCPEHRFIMTDLDDAPGLSRVVLAGTAAELGPVAASDLPVGEDYLGYPINAYGRSKRLSTLSGVAERPPLEVMVARVFNAIGPGLPESQAFGRFAWRLSE